MDYTVGPHDAPFNKTKKHINPFPDIIEQASTWGHSHPVQTGLT